MQRLASCCLLLGLCVVGSGAVKCYESGGPAQVACPEGNCREREGCAMCQKAEARFRMPNMGTSVMNQPRDEDESHDEHMFVHSCIPSAMASRLEPGCTEGSDQTLRQMVTQMVSRMGQAQGVAGMEFESTLCNCDEDLCNAATPSTALAGLPPLALLLATLSYLLFC